MMPTDGPPELIVIGATGVVGGQLCALLDAADARFAIAGRRPAALDALAPLVGAQAVHVLGDDPGALARAIAGARVVINCAASERAFGEDVLSTALEAGAHYVDLGGDQRYVHELYERYESRARKAGKVALLGAAVNGALGDWVGGAAAARVCGATDDDGTDDADRDVRSPVRDRPAPRLAADAPLDELAISYVFDELVLSPGSQRAVFANLHTPGLAWRRDRWEVVPPARYQRRVNAGAALGGDRAVTSFPACDAISLPRHVAARSIECFVSTSRHRATATALRWLARALPLVPARAGELLATYEPEPAAYAATRFAVVAQARRGFAEATVTVTGHDLYRTSAQIVAWCALELAARTTGPVGMCAPSELFRPAAALHALRDRAELVIEA